MSNDPRALIERALDRTRKNALTQLGWGVLGSVTLPLLWGGFTKLVTVLVALNTLIAFVLVRRLIRIRKGGPVVTALLDRPEDVREIASWPRKLPPGRMPVFIDVTTRDSHVGSLMTDAKQPQEVANLLGALHARSPEALLSIPKLTVP